MRTLTRNRCVRLDCEALEDRSVPAGNVTAVYDGLLLRITGDQYANDIRIVGDGGTVQITSGDDLTTINGGASAAFPLPWSMRIDLDSGNNRLSLSNFSPIANGHPGLAGLTILTGMDDDTISVRDVETYPAAFGDGGIAVFSGAGHDLLDLRNFGTFSGLSVVTGNGDDVVRLGGWQQHANVSSVDTGLGNDLIEIDNAPIFPSVPSLYSALFITTGNGDDQVRLAGQQTHGFLFMNLGNGNDVLEIDEASDVRAYDLQLLGGHGDDSWVGSSLLDYVYSSLIADFEEVGP